MGECVIEIGPDYVGRNASDLSGRHMVATRRSRASPR
jgi:hypothetical protein